MEEYLEKELIDFIQTSESPEKWDCFFKNDREAPVGSLIWFRITCRFKFEIDTKLCGVVALSTDELEDIINFMKLRRDRKAVKDIKL